MRRPPLLPLLLVRRFVRRTPAAWAGRAVVALMPLMIAAPAIAQPSAPRIGTPCVTVEAEGQTSGRLDCVSRQVEQAARIAQAQTKAQAGAVRTLRVDGAGSPDVRVGVSSLSGTRLRMGAALGNAVQPDRPVVAPVTPMARP